MTLRTIFETNEDRCGKSALSWWLGMCPCLLRFEVRVAWLKLPLGLSTLSCLQEHKLFFEIFVNLKPVRHCVQAKKPTANIHMRMHSCPICRQIHINVCLFIVCFFLFGVCVCARHNLQTIIFIMDITGGLSENRAPPELNGYHHFPSYLTATFWGHIFLTNRLGCSWWHIPLNPFDLPMPLS